MITCTDKDAVEIVFYIPHGSGYAEKVKFPKGTNYRDAVSEIMDGISQGPEDVCGEINGKAWCGDTIIQDGDRLKIEVLRDNEVGIRGNCS
jgi:hypothetical protein